MLIAIFVLFVILGGYFACCESAFSAMNKIRIKNLAENGNRKAKNAMYVANNFDRALTTLLIGINITHIASASVSTLYVTRVSAMKCPRAPHSPAHSLPRASFSCSAR